MELFACNLKENFQLCEYCWYRNNSNLLIYIKARRIQEKITFHCSCKDLNAQNYCVFTRRCGRN